MTARKTPLRKTGKKSGKHQSASGTRKLRRISRRKHEQGRSTVPTVKGHKKRKNGRKRPLRLTRHSKRKRTSTRSNRKRSAVSSHSQVMLLPAAQPAPTSPEPLEAYPAERRRMAAAILFSKDRAMQLDAAIRSLQARCTDRHLLTIRVLYTASTPDYETQYEVLKREFPEVSWIRENNFKEQLQEAIRDYPFILFMVDDCLFFRDFSLESAIDALTAHPDAAGVSLRLGMNINYAYSHDTGQQLPPYNVTEQGLLKYDWRTGSCDFGYPLEVSSSLYRSWELLPILEPFPYTNPNTLEAGMAAYAASGQLVPSYLLTFPYSAAFCNPVNLVQSVFPNRVGEIPQTSALDLAQRFNEGWRIDLRPYEGLLPNACHQPMELVFRRDEA